MKAAREHRVPLSPRTVIILRKLEKLKSGEFVFPGQRRNKPLSMSMEMVLRRMKIEDARCCARSRTTFPVEAIVSVFPGSSSAMPLRPVWSNHGSTRMRNGQLSAKSRRSRRR